MRSVRAFVGRHPLLSFFALAYGLTWLAWSPYILSLNGVGLLPFHIPKVGGDAQTLGILPGAYLGPVTSAFVVTALADGRAGLRKWAGRLVRWRVGWLWYATILLAVPVGVVFATLPLPGALAGIRLPGLGLLSAYLPMLLLQMITTAAAEEPGWRDFALPRIQQRYGVLLGTFVLGTLWGCWHLPLFFTEWAGWPDVDILMVAEFVISAILLSFVMTWVFNRTKESLPAVMLLHSSVNAFFTLVWPQMFPTLDPFRDSLHAQLIASLVATVVLIVSTRGRLGYRSVNRTEFPVAPSGTPHCV